MGSSAPKPNKRLPEAVPLEAWHLRQAGMHWRAIAATLGLSAESSRTHVLIRRGREIEDRRQRAQHREGILHA